MHKERHAVKKERERERKQTTEVNKYSIRNLKATSVQASSRISNMFSVIGVSRTKDHRETNEVSKRLLFPI